MDDYNNFMFEELNKLLTLKDRKQLSQEDIGKSIDLLKQIDYFHTLNSNYGTDYLILVMQIIQPFILRQAFGLINQNDQYILLLGDLHEEEPKFNSSRQVQPGKLLDLKAKQGVVYMAKSDCKMLRIKKGPSAGLHLEKKLVQMQRDRKRSLVQMQRLLGGQNYKQNFKFLQQISFFSQLGEFDFLQLVGKSEIKQYHHGNITHKYGDKVNKIGCIIAGKIKNTLPRKELKPRGIEVCLNQHDWLGLEQFLFENTFKSTGEVISVVSMVVWVPCQIFQNKFNTKTNYSLINRMKGLVETKKMLFQRGVKCRQGKDTQAELNDRKNINAKLMQKISTFKFTQEKQRNTFRRTKNSLDMQIPERIMHRINYNSELTQLASLPKLPEKTNLFAEQYKTIPIANVYLKEMQRLQKNKNRTLEPKVTRSFTQRNPQQLFQTILQKLPHRRSNQFPKSICPKTFREQKSTIHFNMSIYNNFRVGKKDKQRGCSVVNNQKQQLLDFNKK